ncbi:hypothetical protein TanjilG_02919 [Lupinus angustifolius]|uniref:Secreted protein n=1 Tax=Lupinus angustifolius TaxID=3871 RepID=A0A394DN82_LUPAN|nr:hypothetical protein TanjilG_02919 [Lupinus angustifolius]
MLVSFPRSDVLAWLLFLCSRLALRENILRLNGSDIRPRCDFYHYSRNMACLKCNIGRLEDQPTSEYQEHMWRRES